MLNGNDRNYQDDEAVFWHGVTVFKYLITRMVKNPVGLVIFGEVKTVFRNLDSLYMANSQKVQITTVIGF